MTIDSFVSLDEFALTELKMATSGLLLPARQENLGPVIMTTIRGHRSAIFPKHPRPFSYFFAAEQSLDRAGILFQDPVIEVDHKSLFDCRSTDAPGDLIMGGDRVSLVVQNAEAFGDTERAPLWHGLEAQGSLQLGFRRWRLVSVTRTERRVIFEHDGFTSDVAD